MTPTPEEIKAARKAAGLTQTAAAAVVHAKLRAWQQWEAKNGTASHRAMSAASWELFCIKTKSKAKRTARQKELEEISAAISTLCENVVIVPMF